MTKSKEPKKIVAANAPIAALQTTSETKPEKPKPAKKTKPKAEKPLFTLPDPPAYKPKKADDGWCVYWLWAAHTLDWDDKAKEEAILASIKSHIAKGKKALVEALKDFSDKELMVKTDLKKDPYPYEAHIECWIAEKSEADIKKKLVGLECLTMIDPQMKDANENK